MIVNTWQQAKIGKYFNTAQNTNMMDELKF
jgi:hypothetical protein